jgi:NTP pyrophosphatase (non-canonical NTP hydrolase)
VTAPRRASPTLVDLQEAVGRFRDERDWAQFYMLKDLAAALAVEAGELQKELLWVRPEEERARLELRRGAIAAELADGTILVLNFANAAPIDLAEAVQTKLDENARRYPAGEVRGRAVKYSERLGETDRDDDRWAGPLRCVGAATKGSSSCAILHRPPR